MKVGLNPIVDLRCLQLTNGANTDYHDLIRHEGSIPSLHFQPRTERYSCRGGMIGFKSLCVDFARIAQLG